MVTTLQIHQRIADYYAWKRGFDQVAVSAPAAGVRSYRVWLSEDDRRLVVVEYTFDSRAAAEAFINNPVVRHILALDLDDPEIRLEYLQQMAFASR